MYHSDGLGDRAVRSRRLLSFSIFSYEIFATFSSYSRQLDSFYANKLYISSQEALHPTWKIAGLQRHV